MKLRVLIAGWLSFVLAILIACDSVIYMRINNTTGSSVALGFCGLFLSFAAAAFGISSYDSKNNRT